jgi:hypothetical protein
MLSWTRSFKVAKLMQLEWVPSYGPADGGDPHVREILESPAYVANQWPFGIGRWTGLTLPLDDDDAALLALSRQQLDQAQVDTVRMQLNNWNTLQKLYRDAGWNSASLSVFDGRQFERERVDYKAV